MAQTKSKRRTGKALQSRAAVKKSPQAKDDAVLLGLVERFNTLYREHEKLSDQWHDAREAADADPDMPARPYKPGGPVGDDVRKRRGVNIICDAVNRMGEMMGGVARDIFATRAVTHAGAVAKLRIVGLAYGTGNSDGDQDLEAYQQRDNWLDMVTAEIAALAASE